MPVGHTHTSPPECRPRTAPSLLFWLQVHRGLHLGAVPLPWFDHLLAALLPPRLDRILPSGCRRRPLDAFDRLHITADVPGGGDGPAGGQRALPPDRVRLGGLKGISQAVAKYRAFVVLLCICLFGTCAWRLTASLRCSLCCAKDTQRDALR